MNTNNSFHQARADYVKEIYLQRQKVSHRHIATTTNHTGQSGCY